MKRLIDYASCGGCAGKIPVGLLAAVVEQLPRPSDSNLLVGAEHFSDAGVYRLREDLAIVNTLDFFPPMVNDPFTFGQIAAANAMSDVYTTGAEPKTALNIVAFPDDEADTDILKQILRGAGERVDEASAVIVGGHSLRDKEIKFGLALTGIVDPRRMLTNAGSVPGDALVLTKGLGTGLAVTALRTDQCPPNTLEAAIESMVQLNRGARDAALACHAHAATDVTGFGLGGHANEMALASDVTLVIEANRLPKIAGTEALAVEGHHSRATASNRAFVAPNMQMDPAVTDVDQAYLFDAQTSGGMLISVPLDQADELVEHCRATGAVAACVIGSTQKRGPHTLIVRS